MKTYKELVESNVSLKKYWEMLDAHDWYYGYSDDHRAWQKGQKNSKIISTLANQSKEHKELFKAFNEYMFSGKAYSKPKAPKPKKPA